jgi:hypothetical protein
MKPACPQCHSLAVNEEHGGLFSVHCSVCDWHIEGTANRDLFPRIDPGPCLAARAAAPVSAAALRVVRAELANAKDKAFDDVRRALTTEPGIWVGRVPPFKIDELRAKLSAVGIWLEVPAHEES